MFYSVCICAQATNRSARSYEHDLLKSNSKLKICVLHSKEIDCLCMTGSCNARGHILMPCMYRNNVHLYHLYTFAISVRLTLAVLKLCLRFVLTQHNMLSSMLYRIFSLCVSAPLVPTVFKQSFRNDFSQCLY